MIKNNIPTKDYGVIHRAESISDIDLCAEEVRRNGFSLLNDCLSVSEQGSIRSKFDEIYSQYIARHSRGRLEIIDEANTVRCPMEIDSESMFKLAANQKLLEVISRIIDGKFILNQQNLIINPSKDDYNQGAWHRDLPYQHFTSSTPLSINAIYCVDEFNSSNGASLVLPFSHREPEFPSREYVNQNAVQIEAGAGCVILMDSMLYHSGGFNSTEFPRRAINQVYSIPYIKQQISLPRTLSDHELDHTQLELIGHELDIPNTPEQYLASRERK